MKILIVEDDFVIAESLASELKKWNYGVIVVEQFDDNCLSLTKINLSLYC